MRKFTIQNNCDNIDKNAHPTSKKQKKAVACLKKRCKKGTVKCPHGKPRGLRRGPVLGMAPIFPWNPIQVFPDWLDPDMKWKKWTIGDIAIHEWAHTCGISDKEWGDIPFPGDDNFPPWKIPFKSKKE